MFGLIRKKKVKEAILHIRKEYGDHMKDDPLFRCPDVYKGRRDQYHYYEGNINCANYIESKCLSNRREERKAKRYYDKDGDDNAK